MLLTSFNLYDCTYRTRLSTLQSVLTQSSVMGEQTPGEARSPWLLNIIPSCLLVVYLSLCGILLKTAYGNFPARSALSLASPVGLQDEEKHFICRVLISKARGIDRCLLLAVLMTSKFDIRPLARAFWLVALCLPLERPLPPALLIKLSYGGELHHPPGTESLAPSSCHCLPKWKRRGYLMCTKWDCRRKRRKKIWFLVEAPQQI